MIKRFACAGVGFAMMAVPLVASAQTTTNTASLIATLTALVQQLEQQIQQLLAARASAPQPAGQVSLCTSYADLQRGDTDASTSGRVSQLQAALGISHTTGYHGALTGIGFTNKCVGGNAQPTAVAGMSKYTDAAFGFSFWYPSGWSVQTTVTNGSQALVIIDAGGLQRFVVNTIISSEGLYTPSDNCDELYYFDNSLHSWMQKQSGCDSPTTIQAVDISLNTMGGLHEFHGGGNVQGYTLTIVPISADKFIRIMGGRDNTGQNEKPLADTVVATDPTVAIPVSTAEQTATIQAEASAYAQ